MINPLRKSSGWTEEKIFRLADSLLGPSSTLHVKIFESTPLKILFWAEEYILAARSTMFYVQDNYSIDYDSFATMFFYRTIANLKHKFEVPIPNPDELEFLYGRFDLFSDEMAQTINSKGQYIPLEMMYTLYVNPMKSIDVIKKNSGSHFEKHVSDYMTFTNFFFKNYPEMINKIEAEVKKIHPR